MVQVVHHVPGRLRIRILRLKGSPGEAARVEAQIDSIRGVSNVAANAVTGSVVIHYDARGTRLEAIAAALQLDALRAPGPAGPGASKIAQRVARSLLEALLERSAMALIAAAL